MKFADFCALGVGSIYAPPMGSSLPSVMGEEGASARRSAAIGTIQDIVRNYGYRPCFLGRAIALLDHWILFCSSKSKLCEAIFGCVIGAKRRRTPVCEATHNAPDVGTRVWLTIKRLETMADEYEIEGLSDTANEIIRGGCASMTVVYIIVAVMSLSTAIKTIGDDNEDRYGTECLFFSEYLPVVNLSARSGLEKRGRVSPILMSEGASDLNLTNLEAIFLEDIKWRVNPSNVVEAAINIADVKCFEGQLRDEYTQKSLDEMIRSPFSLNSEWAACIFEARGAMGTSTEL